MLKKIKLTPEQQEQEAAIREIEGFFSEEKPGEIKEPEIEKLIETKKLETEELEALEVKSCKKKIFGKSIAVKKSDSPSSSPYLIDLAVSKRKEAHDREDELNSKDKGKNKFLSFFNFTKKKEEKSRADLTSGGNFLKFRAPSGGAVKIVEKTDAAIRQV
ncbi:MAG: hypothetical protein WC323_04040, partial [Patescibacteria group bacterium]